MNRDYDSSLAVFGVIAIGLALMVGSSPGEDTMNENSVELSNEVEVIDKPSHRGGGGSSGPTVDIINLKVCPYIKDERWCADTLTSDSDSVCIYWEVENGVGCCNTFNCNYREFANACLSDDLKLYEMRIDGEVFKPGLDNYTYHCQATTPWNWHCFDNNELGPHEITIIHKDCSNVVAVSTVQINITSNDNETYRITYEEI